MKVRLFIDRLHAGAVLADVGCGNGKYFLVRPDIAVLGSDRSCGLATVAASRLQAGTGSASGKLCNSCQLESAFANTQTVIVLSATDTNSGQPIEVMQAVMLC